MPLALLYSFMYFFFNFTLNYYILYKYNSVIFIFLVYGLRFDFNTVTITIANPELFLNSILYLTLMTTCFFSFPYLILHFYFYFVSSWPVYKQNKFKRYFLLFLYFHFFAIIITCMDLYNSSWHIIFELAKTYTKILTLNIELDLEIIVNLFLMEYKNFLLYLGILYLFVVFLLENYFKVFLKKYQYLTYILLGFFFIYFFGLTLTSNDLILFVIWGVAEIFVLLIHFFTVLKRYKTSVTLR